MSKRLFVIALLLITIVLGSSLIASAQQPQPPQQPVMDGERPQGPPRSPRLDDPLADDLFPPDMIMQHQRELALTDVQKTFMRGEIQKTTTRFNELQWQLQDAMEALHETMKGSQVNEQLALQQLNKVLDAEREIKALHMGMAIRIKNQLTPDQQMKLQTMRNTFQPDGRRDRRPGGPGPDGPGRPRPGGPDGGMRPGGPGPGGPGGGGPRPGGGRPGGPGR
jgi:Spy/CpxP family protein refolding chaperone